MDFDWLSAESARLLAAGAMVTVLLTVITTLFASAAAVVATSGQLSERPIVRSTWRAYIELFRNVPALIQIIFWAFAFPTVFPDDLRQRVFFDNAIINAVGELSGLPLPYYAVAACLGLVLNTSAHLAEILRAGIGSVPTEHLDAARTIGATRRAAFFAVALPAAVRVTFPGISNRLVHNMKNTALASFVAVPELFHEMQSSINRTFRATEYLLLAAAVYLTLSLIMTAGLGAIDRHLRGQGALGG